MKENDKLEKLKELGSMDLKVMIHRILRKDYKVNKLILRYKWKYLTIIKREEN